MFDNQHFVLNTQNQIFNFLVRKMSENISIDHNPVNGISKFLNLSRVIKRYIHIINCILDEIFHDISENTTNKHLNSTINHIRKKYFVLCRQHNTKVGTWYKKK